MALLIRWFTYAFVCLALLAAAGLGLAYYVASRSLPEYDRTFRVAGPEAEIEIVRDSHAVPHILSKTDADGFFGLGFVHAQDRLWQMTLMRRTAQGRLSELFGEDTLEIDELMRALDLHALSARAVSAQNSDTRMALDAYARGVNAWLRLVQEEALGRGAPEFFLFDRQISPWSPADSIAILKLMALRLTDKAGMETLRAVLSLRLAPDRLRDILPEAPNAPVMALPDFAALFEGAPNPDWRAAERGALDPVGPVGLAGASNAFAATGDRTAGGATLLATDPHLMLTAPSIWMLARMDLAEGPVMGATIPGVPVVMLGRNATLAWGITSSYLDDQDIYIERLNPENDDEYLTPDGFRPFETRRTTIGVRDAPDETRVLRATRHGPVIPGTRFDVHLVTPPDHVATLAWTGLIEEDRSIGAAIALMRVGTIREARSAARDFVAPSLMLTLAERDAVALQMIGAAPARQAGHTSQGRIPAPGWLAVNDWEGMRPYAENPWVMNPDSGIVVNTNNRITDAAFPDHLSFDWGDAYRITRAERLLNAREFHTRESFIEIQTDVVSDAARTLLPLIARDLWYSGDADGPARDLRAAALDRLADWNGEMSEHAPEPMIYAAWVRALKRRLAIDELGSMVDSLPGPDPVFLERVFRNVDGAGVWCDVVQTSETESCAEMARRALDDALAELSERYGTRLESWRWGDAHQAVHLNETLGRIPALDLLVNIRQSTGGGDNTLMRGQMTGRAPEPYANVHAAGFRAVHDFSDPDSSVWITSTGQSGHPLSRFYDDQSTIWRRKEYIPMSLDAERARSGAIGVTRIAPSGG